MLLSAEIDDERSTTGALSASGSSCHFCVAHSHSPRPFYSKHHAKLEEKIIFFKKSPWSAGKTANGDDPISENHLFHFLSAAYTEKE